LIPQGLAVSGDNANWIRQKHKRETLFYWVRGRPRGRSDDSSPSWAAVDCCQLASPNGVPRERLWRNALSSVKKKSKEKGSGAKKVDWVIWSWQRKKGGTGEHEYWVAAECICKRSGTYGMGHDGQPFEGEFLGVSSGE